MKPSTGFAWHRSEVVWRDEENLYSPNSLSFLPDGVTRYFPLDDEPGAFLELAHSDSYSLLREFASRYGAIVERYAYVGMERVEPWSDWCSAQGWMQQCVRLWQSPEGDLHDTSTRFLLWYCEAAMRRGSRTVSKAEEDELPPGTPLTSFYRYERLTKSTEDDKTPIPKAARSMLLAEVGATLAHSCVPELAWSADGKEVECHFRPRTLWGALVLQLCMAITEGKQFQKCTMCTRWFEVGSGGGRSHRQTCSSRCRNAAHRQRVAKAAELAMKGVNVSEIAKELGTEEATVQKWIADSQPKKTEDQSKPIDVTITEIR